MLIVSGRQQGQGPQHPLSNQPSDSSAPSSQPMNAASASSDHPQEILAAPTPLAHAFCNAIADDGAS